LANTLKRTSEEGFTLIELMIVIAIIGILASIAIANFIGYRKLAYNVSALLDARTAFVATIAYFADHPGESISSLGVLTAYGFRQTADVAISPSGSQSALSLVAYHASGDKTYTVDSVGAIHK
jgi:prepilin-type N-terminal cleavage/methylation domain-containing protein